jgi:hypothetical protein
MTGGGSREIGRADGNLPGSVALVRIKADLPQWPDEVIEQWLLKVANRGPETGWPPPEPLKEPCKFVLGERPLSWWRAVTWRLEEHELNIDRLSASTRRVVREMIDAHIGGVSNVHTRVPESKLRFTAALEYVSEHGTIPKPPLAMRMRDGIIVIDGNHRVAALCVHQEQERKNGSIPLEKHKIWTDAHPDMKV